MESSFPVKKKNISKIEKMNILAVNVFSNEGNLIIINYILKTMKKVSKKRTVNLLYIKIEGCIIVGLRT